MQEAAPAYRGFEIERHEMEHEIRDNVMLDNAYPESDEGARLRARAAAETLHSDHIPKDMTIARAREHWLRMADKVDRAAWIFRDKPAPDPKHGAWGTTDARRLRKRINRWSNGRRGGATLCDLRSAVYIASTHLSMSERSELTRLELKLGNTPDGQSECLYAICWSRAYRRSLADWPGMVNDLSESDTPAS